MRHDLSSLPGQIWSGLPSAKAGLRYAPGTRILDYLSHSPECEAPADTTFQLLESPALTPPGCAPCHRVRRLWISDSGYPGPPQNLLPKCLKPNSKACLHSFPHSHPHKGRQVPLVYALISLKVAKGSLGEVHRALDMWTAASILMPERPFSVSQE